MTDYRLTAPQLAKLDAQITTAAAAYSQISATTRNPDRLAAAALTLTLQVTAAAASLAAYAPAQELRDAAGYLIAANARTACAERIAFDAGSDDAQELRDADKILTARQR